MGLYREHHPSLWVSTTERGEYPPMPRTTTADVVVIGAGLAGLLTARLAVERGRSVVVIDAGPICAGATGYTTAKITSLHGLMYGRIADEKDEGAARLYGEANERGIAMIERIVRDEDIDCAFERKAHVVYTLDQSRVDDFETETELTHRLGLPVATDPHHDLPFEVAAAIRFEDQAQFHPRRFCLGVTDALIRSGASVYSHTRATHIDGSARVVSTDRGEIHADTIVVATHIPFGEMGLYFARAEPSRSYALAVRVEGERPDLMAISADQPVRSLRTAGEHLIVGGEGHVVGEDHDTNAHYRALEDWARAHFDVQSIDHRWSAQDWASGDGRPFIGRMTGHPEGVFVATAFAKWGMAHGAVAAMLIDDLAAGKDNEWEDLYDATRLVTTRNLRTVASEVVATAKHLVADRIGHGDKSTVDALPPGGSAIVRLDGDDVAVFRDPYGEVHAVSAVCTHLGCLVAFNNAEQTWDCPCHGSRYDIEGAVIEGPTVVDLEIHPLPE